MFSLCNLASPRQRRSGDWWFDSTSLGVKEVNQTQDEKLPEVFFTFFSPMSFFFCISESPGKGAGWLDFIITLQSQYSIVLHRTDHSQHVTVITADRR